MKTKLMKYGAALMIAAAQADEAAEISLEAAPPVVVKTWPTAGSVDVDPGLKEISVTFSKKMMDGSWSWSTWGQENFPEMDGKPAYKEDGITCVLPVKLQPNKFYATWLNSENFKNFKDPQGRAAVPYLLTFQTKAEGGAAAPDEAKKQASVSTPAPSVEKAPEKLNPEQRAVFDWTQKSFRGFFDGRDFASWSEKDRAELEKKLIDTLKGPVSREYYMAINTLGAMGSMEALPELRKIAFDRREKDNRDRWMAVRAIGLIGDEAASPELIHLTYHGNSNTRWWAQISLVRLTGENFGGDWKAWGEWWNKNRGEPKFDRTTGRTRSACSPCC